MSAGGFCPSCGMTFASEAIRCTNCGALLPAGDEPSDARGVARELADALGPGYEVMDEIGRGGFARVFRVRDRQLDRWLAAKVILPELVASAEVRERFRREAMTVVRLAHPNIVPIYFVPASSRLTAFVMPLIDGESLASRLGREGGLPLAVAGAVLQDVAGALDAAHAVGIVHRDVKPDNILLESQSGRALLTDFGIARAPAAAAANLTGTGQVLGTPYYLSPEQASGERSVDRRSDVYSLGVVAFEMVAGQRPFDAASAQALFAMHAAVPCPDVRRFRPEVSSALAAAVERAVAKDPEGRFASAGDFAAAFVAGVGRRSLRTSMATVVERMPAGDVGLFRTTTTPGASDVAAVLRGAEDLGALRDAVAAVGASVRDAVLARDGRRAAQGVLSLVDGARDDRPAFRGEVNAALSALARDAALIEVLARLWQRGEAEGQAAVEDALASLMPQAGPLLLALARRDRQADLVLLADRTGALSDPEALAFARDQSPGVASLLLGALAESQRAPDSIERWLGAALRHPRAEVRTATLAVALQRGGALAERMGRIGLGDRDAAVRIAALDTLGASRRKETIPDLARVLEAGGTDEQVRAAEALGALALPEATLALERALTRRRFVFFKASAAEEAALGALERMRHESAVAALARLAGQPGPARELARKALERRTSAP